MRMRVNQTAKIKIKTTSDIVETIDAYKSAMQFCINVAWEKGIKNKRSLWPLACAQNFVRAIGDPNENNRLIG